MFAGVWKIDYPGGLGIQSRKFPHPTTVICLSEREISVETIRRKQRHDIWSRT